MPVSLACFLPHDNIKTGTVLVAEYKAGVVIVGISVDKEGARKIDSAEGVVTWINEKYM